MNSNNKKKKIESIRRDMMLCTLRAKRRLGTRLTLPSEQKSLQRTSLTFFSKKQFLEEMYHDKQFVRIYTR